MNAGNKTRGQADGYQLDALSKTVSIKDTDGNSILKLICKKLNDEDPLFIDFKQSFLDAYECHRCSIEGIKLSCEKAKKDLESNKSLFYNILKIDPDTEQQEFCKKITKFFEEDCDGKVEETNCDGKVKETNCDSKVKETFDKMKAVN